MRVLVIAPHPDDEVLGVGGTIAKHAANGKEVYVCIVTRGKGPLFDEETVERSREECRNAAEILGVKQTIFLDFPAAMMEECPRYELNDALLKVVRNVQAEEVYLPHRGDMQLDHKMTSDAAMVALRPKYPFSPRRIYAYETLSETGWDIPNTVNEFIPMVYSDITDYLSRKLDALRQYQSQLSEYPNPRSIEAVEALARFRGSIVNVCAAEALSLIREIR